MISQYHPSRKIVMDYAQGVVDGEIVAGRLVKWACQRFLKDLKQQSKKDFPHTFSWPMAYEALDFFPLLEHTTGQYDGQPFHLFPCQQFVVANIFGWRKKQEGTRRFKHAFYSVARGNGKSPLAAGITLFCFAFDNPSEARAECYTVATKRDQAAIIFDEVARFVDRNPDLGAYIEKRQHFLQIPSNYSKLRALSSEGKSADGLIPHVVAADELHAWKDEHKELWEKLETAMGKRRQPLMLITTTAGSEESELWNDQYNYCRQVLDPDANIEDDQLFAFIAEIDDEDDELEPCNWPKANPMLEYGIVKRDYLESLATQAKVNPVKRHEFRRYHGNKLTYSTNKIFTYEMWAKGNEPLPDLSGCQCFLGFDWGWKDDLAALGYVFPIDTIDVAGEWKPRYAIAADVWIPDETKRDLTREPWCSWIKHGWLRVTEGCVTDIGAVHRRMAEVIDDINVCSLAVDPNNAREFSQKCINEWGISTYAFPQSHGKYHEPTKELMNALIEGRIVHGGNPLLAWCAVNVAVQSDSKGYIMPVKKRSQDKIDPIVAIIMALSEAMFAERSTVRYEKGSISE